MLTQQQQNILLRTARTAIESALQGTESLPARTNDPALLARCGAFVTLHVLDELRGCIGYIESEGPLIETVREAALRAAFEDLRFEPLRGDELENLSIEISVLSPLREIRDVSEIRVGEHGLLIQLGHQRGLLLPQVPVEHGWDRETFLSQTARKAALPADAWKSPGVRLYLFTAEVFHEKKNYHVV